MYNFLFNLSKPGDAYSSVHQASVGLDHDLLSVRHQNTIRAQMLTYVQLEQKERVSLKFYSFLSRKWRLFRLSLPQCIDKMCYKVNYQG